MAINTAATQPTRNIDDSTTQKASGTAARPALELVLTESVASPLEEQRRRLAASRRANARRSQAASQALLVPGLAYTPRLLTQDEEDSVLAALEAVPCPTREPQNPAGYRQPMTFGWHDACDRSGAVHSAAIPQFLLTLRGRVAEFSGIDAEQWQQVEVATEEPCSGDWRQERPVFEQFVEVVVGAAATLRLRQRASEGFDRRTLPLEPGSAYLLSGEARHGWGRRLDQGAPTGWTVRFRTLSARGLRR